MIYIRKSFHGESLIAFSRPTEKIVGICQRMPSTIPFPGIAKMMCLAEAFLSEGLGESRGLRHQFWTRSGGRNKQWVRDNSMRKFNK